jgi:hypothetical protein
MVEVLVLIVREEFWKVMLGALLANTVCRGDQDVG